MTHDLYPLAEDFWPKVDKETCLGAQCGCHRQLGHCWPWTGTIDQRRGYGYFPDQRYKSHRILAHRLAWELTYGPIADGMVVCHTCDVAHCQNPTHLFLGTKRDSALYTIGKHGRTPAERYWLKVNTETCLGDICGCHRGLGCCWPWIACIHATTGYGLFSDRQRSRLPIGAHRIAWELAYGPIPDKLIVCHICDVRKCQNPRHMFLGSIRDNILDAVKKNRNVKGVRSPSHKLTEADVHAIIQLRGTLSHKAIAQRFHVNPSTIGYVLRGETWAHITKDYGIP